MKDEIGPIVKGVLSAVPYAGGAVTWWTDRQQSRINSRLEEFAKWAESEISNMRAEQDLKIDAQYLESDDFREFVFDLIDSYLRETSASKSEAYRAVFSNLFSDWRPSEALRQQYLNLLASTTEIEIRVLSAIYRLQATIPEEGLSVLFEKHLPKEALIRVSELATTLDLSSAEISNVVWALAGRGLLFQDLNDLSSDRMPVLSPMALSFARFITSSR